MDEAPSPNVEPFPYALRMLRLSRLIAALWLGSAVFLMVAASAAFGAAPDASVAADVVGAMLARWHYLALLAPLALLAIEWRRARLLVTGLLFVGILFAATEAMVDIRIRGIRAHVGVPISMLPRESPTRRNFGMLHGVSSMLLLLQAFVAAGVVIAIEPAIDPITEPTIEKL